MQRGTKDDCLMTGALLIPDDFSWCGAGLLCSTGAYMLLAALMTVRVLQWSASPQDPLAASLWGTRWDKLFFFSKKELNTGNRFERWKTFPWASTLRAPCVWRSSTIGSQWWVEGPRRCSPTPASSVTGTNQVQTWLLRINLCFQLELWSDRPRWMAWTIWKTFSWS